MAVAGDHDALVMVLDTVDQLGEVISDEAQALGGHATIVPPVGALARDLPISGDVLTNGYTQE
jgi:hypothetical protein